MNGPHLHLVLNHLPVVGLVVGTLLLALSVATRRDPWIRLSLGVVVLAGLSAAPAYLTGEPAEKGLQGLPGVARAAIEPHEEAAEIALGVSIAAAAAALAGIVVGWRRPAVPFPLAALALVAALAASGAIGWAANLGGHIRHPEIGGGVAPSGSTGAPGIPKHDDD